MDIKKVFAKVAIGVTTLICLGGQAAPVYAYTVQKTQTFSLKLQGQSAQIKETMLDSTHRQVIVTMGGQTASAIYDMDNKNMRIQTHGQEHPLNLKLSQNTYPQLKTVNPFSVGGDSASVGENIWGDYANENFSSSGTTNWSVGLGTKQSGGLSRLLTQNPNNESALSSYFTDVSNLSSMEWQFFGAASGALISAAITILTSETVLVAVVAALIAIGLGTLAVSFGEQCWNDHQVDIMAYHQI